MFVGHYGVGFAMKRVLPRVSLGWMIAAPQLLDLLWPWFLLLGWERVRVEPGNTAFTPLAFDSYPWSHSLMMAVVWGIVFGGIYFTGAHRIRPAVWLAAGVVSHWILDWVTHRPDLPIAPGLAGRYGLGLWNSTAATLLVESAIFIAGTWLYARMTRARDRAGSLGFWSFVAFLTLIYVSNLFGPPPPGEKAIAIVTLVLWLFPFWAAWFDHHRVVSIE